MLACPASSRADAPNLQLDGERYWVVLASRQDEDRAIAAAFNPRMETLVVRAENGWYAAIAGPVTAAKGSGRAVLDGLIKDKGIPNDAYLTRGAGFTDVVWTKPATNQIATLAYDGEHDATLRKDGLDIALTRKPDGDGSFAPVARVTYRDKPAFVASLGEDNPAEKPASDAALVRLDPAAPLPAVVLTYFWQGAHCCTVTRIVTMDGSGAWHLIDGETLDGGGGYAFEDLGGRGFSLLVSSDQAFYYAFSSFAESSAPLRLHQLVGGRLVDVTSEPRYRHKLLQNLYADETYANATPDLWSSNGFLAAWVAESIMVGQGRSAWTKMLAGYDHHSDFGPDKCLVAQPLEKCPDAKRVKLAFPFALRAFLVEHGYIENASAYPVPYEVEPK